MDSRFQNNNSFQANNCSVRPGCLRTQARVRASQNREASLTVTGARSWRLRLLLLEVSM